MSAHKGVGGGGEGGQVVTHFEMVSNTQKRDYRAVLAP